MERYMETPADPEPALSEAQWDVLALKAILHDIRLRQSFSPAYLIPLIDDALTVMGMQPNIQNDLAMLEALCRVLWCDRINIAAIFKSGGL